MMCISYKQATTQYISPRELTQSHMAEIARAAVTGTAWPAVVIAADLSSAVSAAVAAAVVSIMRLVIACLCLSRGKKGAGFALSGMMEGSFTGPL